MKTNWLQYLLLIALILPNNLIYGYSDIEARLVIARKYVEKGSSVTLYCEHNVDPKILYKVTWLKEGTGKFFQFIKNRNPPYRNFSIPGTEIDWKNSNEEQVHLEKLDFDAAGKYYCEVSTDTPIFTKESNVEQMHIIVQQTGPPRITFSKRQFTIGENLVANCTTSKAHPAPHITWLINGKLVDEKYIKIIHLHSGGSSSSGSSGKNSRRSKTSTNSQSRDKHESSAVAHIRSYASPMSQSSMPSSVDWSRDEPLAANGKHLGFEIRQNSAQNRHITAAANNIRNLRNRNNGFHSHSIDDGDDDGFDGSINSGSHIETSDYSDDKYFETKKHRNPHRSTHRRHRRYTNDLTGSSTSNNSIRHRLVATSSQLTIEVSELHALNGRLEISCLATIPAHVKPGEQFADYKTYSVKIDIDTVETTTILAPISDMAAFGNSSSSSSSFYSIRIASVSFNLPIILFILFNSLQIIKYFIWAP